MELAWGCHILVLLCSSNVLLCDQGYADTQHRVYMVGAQTAAGPADTAAAVNQQLKGVWFRKAHIGLHLGLLHLHLQWRHQTFSHYATVTWQTPNSFTSI